MRRAMGETNGVSVVGVTLIGLSLFLQVATNVSVILVAVAVPVIAAAAAAVALPQAEDG